MAIKFNKFNVVDTETKTKARISYALDNRADGRKCVTLYAKDYGNALGQMFGDAFQNETDSMTDYFEKGRVRLFENHPLYGTARAKAEALEMERRQKLAANFRCSELPANG